MRARPVSLIVAVLAMVAASPSAAQPVQPLQPLKNWVVDYAEAMCTAAREYGDPENPITFGIRPAPTGETYELLIGRNRAGPAYAEEMEGSVDFGRGPMTAWMLHYGSNSKKHDVYQFRISAADMAQARSASTITFRAKGGPDTSFILRSMPALLDGLDKCTADLKRYWNMDGRDNGTIAIPAKGDVRSAFTPNDYPNEAIARRQEGTAQFLLLIDEKGGVAGCHVQKASGVPVLDAMGCQAIRERAKFTPAMSSTGKPVRSTVVTPPVRWVLGG